MFDWFKGKKDEASDTPSHAHVPELLGFRLGGAVELNDLKLKLIEDDLIFENVAKIQLIQAVGVVRLDEGSTILRYYTDGEGFFQFVLNGGMGENNIDDAKLWFYYDTVGISSEHEWNRQIESDISRANYELEGRSFTPLWRDASGVSPPVAMTETTYLEDGSSSETDQFVMLYEREANTDLDEFLMVSGEEKIIDNQADRSLVLSTGIDIHSADFEVVG